MHDQDLSQASEDLYKYFYCHCPSVRVISQIASKLGIDQTDNLFAGNS